MKNHLKYFFLSVLFTLFLVCLNNSVALADELTGKVVRVNGYDIAIELNSRLIPSKSDPVVLILDQPELGELFIGTWQVLSVQYPMVEARFVEATGEAEIGVT